MSTFGRVARQRPVVLRGCELVREVGWERVCPNGMPRLSW